ncbi:hypothetical protein GF339_00635 [candidate division KSB3 bacterium]|uniref:Dehydrogenase n=1 Tax=candidate division KSB3 bacterium TaxID=2044937 RepID=A0A9D5Q407_9BACT|nr:hypothetical protein [candidate division KSB3 bacterium]MBD3323055.1 hypothetical protein [candidate division KSB3 bacterium]
MKAMVQTLYETLQQGQRVTLATVISRKGSLPMSKRAKMLVFQDGSIEGTIGGGALEASVIQEARQALRTGIPSIVAIDLTAAQIEAEGLTCGGTVEILLEPLTPATNMAVMQELVQIYTAARPAVVVTVLNSDAWQGPRADAQPDPRIVIRADGTMVGSLGDSAVDAEVVRMASPYLGTPYLGRKELEFGQDQAHSPLQVFIESILPAPVAYLFGGGHIALHLSRLLPMIGFEYVVIDDRQEFVTHERFPTAQDRIFHSFEQVLEKLTLMPETSYLIIVTRGHKSDLIVLEQAVQTNVRYIGMIGSQRKINLVFQHIQAHGVAPERLDAVHAPIGLEIGADTPEEIAVSIAAELIKVRRSG